VIPLVQEPGRAVRVLVVVLSDQSAVLLNMQAERREDDARRRAECRTTYISPFCPSSQSGPNLIFNPIEHLPTALRHHFCIPDSTCTEKDLFSNFDRVGVLFPHILVQG